jgi:prepilin-type N-terminal cleavage/methylation domain-containing protein
MSTTPAPISTGHAGFSLIEALVALLIFSIAAVGLAETLIAAQATRRTSALSSEASQLAVAETERARAGLPTTGTLTVAPFACSTAIEAVPDYEDLQRIRIKVDWMDRGARTLELVTLMSTRGNDE